MKYIFTLTCKNVQTTVKCKMFVCSLQYEAGTVMVATAVTVVTTRCATSMASPPTPTNTPNLPPSSKTSVGIIVRISLAVDCLGLCGICLVENKDCDARPDQSSA